MAIDVSLLIVRVLVGLSLAAYGSQKLFGWFGGFGLAGFSGMLKQMGMKGAPGWAVLGGLGEFVGGLFLVLGLLNPIGGIAIFAVMLMAIVKWAWSKGFWSQKGGFELPLLYLVIASAAAVAGPGRYSLDAAFGLSLPTITVFAAGAACAVLVAVFGAILRTKGEVISVSNS